MNLVLDFGNTRVKAAAYVQDHLQETQVFDSENELFNSPFFKQNFSAAIIGTVTEAHQGTLNNLQARMPVHLFSQTSKVPLKNAYASARTLGSDRMAVAVGAYVKYPQQNVLSIDAGTCIKYNFVDKQNTYRGGAISPGIAMRLKAMHHYTAALPLVELDAQFDELIGNSTQTSLLSGAQLGAVAEVDGCIERYLAKFPNLIVVLTGGDAPYLSRHLKNRFFAHQHLLTDGLNKLLSINL